MVTTTTWPKDLPQNKNSLSQGLDSTAMTLFNTRHLLMTQLIET